MTKLEALKELEAVVVANEEDTGVDVFIAAFSKISEVSDSVTWGAISAYNGSVDAAKTLREAVLPGWVWSFPYPEMAMLRIPSDKNASATIPFTVNGMNNIPSRAWLIFIIRALISESEDDDD